MKTVKTVTQFRRALQARKPFVWRPSKPAVAVHGGYTVEIAALHWEPENGYYGSWEKQALEVRVNGRTLMVPKYGYFSKLPKPYGFVARVAFAKAKKAKDNLWYAE